MRLPFLYRLSLLLLSLAMLWQAPVAAMSASLSGDPRLPSPITLTPIFEDFGTNGNCRLRGSSGPPVFGAGDLWFERVQDSGIFVTHYHTAFFTDIGIVSSWGTSSNINAPLPVPGTYTLPRRSNVSGAAPETITITLTEADYAGASAEFLARCHHSVDGTEPTLITRTIASNNADTSRAKAGDTITLSMISDEALATPPTVTIAGQTAMVTGSGTSFTATTTVGAGTANGNTAINISDYTDAAGNRPFFAVTSTSDGSTVNIDTTAPMINTVTIASDNANPTLAGIGSTITVSIITDQNLGTVPTVTIAGQAAAVTGSGRNFTATTTVTAATPAGNAAISITGYADPAGNTGAAVNATTDASSVDIDKAAPALTTVTIASDNADPARAMAGDTITVTIAASEALGTAPTVTIAGQAALVTGAGGSFTASVTVTGATTAGNAAISISGYTDESGNAGAAVTATTNGSAVNVDTSAPTLPTVTIVSSNADPAQAMAGDTVTVSITASEALGTAPTVTIGGLAANVTGGGTSFTATVTVTGAVAAGNIAINITGYADLSGNAGAPVTATTNGSAINVDTEPPTVAISGQPTDHDGATPFTVTITFSEAVTGFDNGDLTATSATVGPLAPAGGAGTVFTATITPAGAFDITIAIAAGVAIDIAGNANTAATPVTVGSTIIEDTLQAISNFMMQRSNAILANRPDLSGFITGTNLAVGGPLGFLAIDANEINQIFRFSTSRSKIAATRDKSIEARLNGAFGEPNGFGDGNSGNGDEASASSTYQAAMSRAGSWDVWTEAYGSNSSSGGSDASLMIAYLGAHYFVSDDMLVGVIGQFDWAEETNSATASRADGFGWMAGPYIAGRLPGQDIVYEARIAYGQSQNDITPVGTFTDTFDTERWLASARIAGAYQLGKLTVSPATSVAWYRETQQAYVDSLANPIPEQTISLGELRFGPTFTYRIEQGGGITLLPSFGIGGIWNFDVDTSNASQAVEIGDESLRARLDAGFAATNALGWQLVFKGFYDGLGAAGYEAYGGSVRLVMPLN